MNARMVSGIKENDTGDLLPIETVLDAMESDCGMVASAARDYFFIHRDEYRGDKNVDSN